ncbi:MAG: hypothetical protein JRN46_05995 [Nitrososphaerota archaeon]|nr:hypothetical protein [Nitrososphaerota archaeon]
MSDMIGQEAIVRRLMMLEKRISDLEVSLKLGADAFSGSPTAGAPGYWFDDLPTSLTRTLRAMHALGEGDATAVSKKTGKSRSVATIYLNQLVRLGALTRARAGKKVLFRIDRFC